MFRPGGQEAMSDLDAETRWSYIATFTAFVCSVKLSARVVCCFGVQQISVVGTLRSGVWTRILTIRLYISVQKGLLKHYKKRTLCKARWMLGKDRKRFLDQGWNDVACATLFIRVEWLVSMLQALSFVQMQYGIIRVYIADIVVERICYAY